MITVHIYDGEQTRSVLVPEMISECSMAQYFALLDSESIGPDGSASVDWGKVFSTLLGMDVKTDQVTADSGRALVRIFEQIKADTWAGRQPKFPDFLPGDHLTYHDAVEFEAGLRIKSPSAHIRAAFVALKRYCERYGQPAPSESDTCEDWLTDTLFFYLRFSSSMSDTNGQ